MALRLIVSILERMPGIEAHGFGSAAEALSCARTMPFDIAFLDIMVGGTDGTDFAQSLLDLQPQCRIIYCTGYLQYAVEGAKCSIVDGYLLKPIEEQKLQEILKRTKASEPA